LSWIAAKVQPLLRFAFALIVPPLAVTVIVLPVAPEGLRPEAVGW